MLSTPVINSDKPNKVILILLIFWVAIITFALLLFSIIRLKQPLLQTDYVRSTLNNLKFTLTGIYIFSSISSLTLIISSFSNRFAKILFYFNLGTLTLGLVGIAGGILLPCEELGCILNGFIGIPSIVILAISLTNIPALVLLLKPEYQKPIRLLAVLFVIISFAGGFSLYTYESKTLPSSVQSNIKNAQKTYGFTFFKPDYLPQRQTSSHFEGVKTALRGKNGEQEYYIQNFYGDGSFELHESKVVSLLEEFRKRDGVREVNIANNNILIDSGTSKYGNPKYNFALFMWNQNGTNFDLRYQSTSISTEILEAELTKVTQSLKPIE